MEEKQSITATIPIEKYYEQRVIQLTDEIRHVKDLMDKDKELVTTKEKLTEKALKLQHEETIRRLEALNHEAQRLSIMIPRVEFEKIVDGLEKELKEIKEQRITEIKEELKILQLWKSYIEGKAARNQIIAIGSALIGLVALLLNLFYKK